MTFFIKRRFCFCKDCNHNTCLVIIWLKIRTSYFRSCKYLYRKRQNGTSVQLALCANFLNIKIISFNPEEQKVEHIKFSEPHASWSDYRGISSRLIVGFFPSSYPLDLAPVPLSGRKWCPSVIRMHWEVLWMVTRKYFCHKVTIGKISVNKNSKSTLSWITLPVCGLAEIHTVLGNTGKHWSRKYFIVCRDVGRVISVFM